MITLHEMLCDAHARLVLHRSSLQRQIVVARSASTDLPRLLRDLDALEAHIIRSQAQVDKHAPPKTYQHMDPITGGIVTTDSPDSPFEAADTPVLP